MAFQVETQSPKQRSNHARHEPPTRPAHTRRAALASTGYDEGTQMLRPPPQPTPGTQGPASLAHGPKNTQTVGDEGARKEMPPEVAQALKRKGYLVYPVQSLNVLNAAAKENADASLARQKVGSGGYNLVTSGTFYYQNQGKNVPAGAVMRDGKLDTPGVPKAAQRGGVAVLQDGTIVMGRMAGGNAADIQRRFGSPDNPVKDFMGGGALLVEDGKAVSHKDLLEVQKFDQGAGGINAQQMRKTDHVVLGVREGRAYVIVAKNKTGKEIQSDLAAAGFGTVVKYDGGSGGYARDASGVKAGGVNPTGFGVR